MRADWDSFSEACILLFPFYLLPSRSYLVRDLTLFIVTQLRKIVLEESGQYVFNPEHFIAIIMNKDQIQTNTIWC